MKAAAPQKSTDNCWDLFKNPDYPDQRRHANPGSKFGAGFMRRQQPAIKQDEVRLAYAEERSARLQQAAVLRTERLVANSNVAYHGRAPTPPHHERSYTGFLLLHALSNVTCTIIRSRFDVVTGADDGRAAWRPSKRGVPGYNKATRGDDAPIGRRAELV